MLLEHCDNSKTTKPRIMGTLDPERRVRLHRMCADRVCLCVRVFGTCACGCACACAIVRVVVRAVVRAIVLRKSQCIAPFPIPATIASPSLYNPQVLLLQVLYRALVIFVHNTFQLFIVTSSFFFLPAFSVSVL